MLSCLLAAPAGCSFEADGLPGVGPTIAADAPNPNAAACGWNQPPLYFDPCDPDLDVGPAQDLDDTGNGGVYVYDTDTGDLTDPGGGVTTPPGVVLDGTPPIRLWPVDALEIQTGVTLRSEGSMPLLLASFSTTIIRGTVDVSSRFSFTPGAGADDLELCEVQVGGNGGANTEGGGGGGGGGFQFEGGRGGNSREESVISTGGRAGGALAGTPTLRGGCPGGDGGAGEGDSSGVGLAGSGGGAVHLVARDALTLTGELLAGGSGGGGAATGGAARNRSGGGGGGSGGYAGVEAPTIRMEGSAVAASNGGGGGAGTDKMVRQPGADGLAANEPAPGSDGEGDKGGDGGAGGYGVSPRGEGGRAGERGGGGGGGGVGFVVIRGEVTTVNGTPVISPTPIIFR